MRNILSALLLALVCFVPQLRAQTHPAYGFLAGSDDYPLLLNHLVSFDLDTETTQITDVMTYSGYTTAADWVDGKYYVAGSKVVASGEIPDMLMIFDLKNGQFSSVAPITGINRFINDMAYDNSRKKMYAVARLSPTDATSNHALYTIDLTTGVATKIGSDLGRRIATLACSYDGELYAVDALGAFCSIDPAAGTLEEIGNTGVVPSGRNSMTFDHSTGTLYWTCMYRKTGDYMEMDISDLRTIDVESGQSFSLKSTGSNTQISGLYIPYSAAASNAPAHVSDFLVTPGASGANTATITWTNPTRLFGGGNLTSITRVEIYRDDVKIAEVTDAVPGRTSRYVDNITGSTGAMHTYKIMACNAAGPGAPSQTTVFVGQDVPSKVRNLVVSRPVADAALITWDASDGGANGGFVTTPVYYTVRRMPDRKLVAEGITECSVRDNNVSPMGTYTYTVMASNRYGDSELSETEPVTLGPAIELPYSCGFSEEEFGDWSVVDANGDGMTWVREWNSAFHSNSIRYDGTGSNKADDYAVLHCANIKEGSTYKVTFSTTSYRQHNLEFVLLRNGNTTDVAQVVHLSDEGQHYSVTTKEFTFVAQEGGVLNMALHVVSEPGNSHLMVYSFTMEELVDVNLAALSVNGTPRPVAGNTYTYNVSVVNRGTQAVAGYKAELIDADGVVLASAMQEGTVAPEASVSAPVIWTVPADFSGTELYGRVEAEGDGVVADNVSPALAVAVQPAGSDELVLAGAAEGYGNTHPFNAYDKKSAALNIYQASEIGLQRGRISHLEWQSKSTFKEVPAMDIKVYLANTDRTKAPDGFLPESEMTLVYQGTVKVEKSSDPVALGIDLDQPFLYTGGNLAVLTLSSVPQYTSQVNFAYYTSPVEGNSCYSVADDNMVFDFTQTGTARTGTSVIAMNVRTAGHTVAGAVTDMSGNPLEGVKVRVSQNGDVAYTDAEGHYELEFLADGEYDVEFMLFGYPEVTRKVSVSGEDAALDVALSNIPAHTLSGTAVSVDGKPVTGATVTVEGYETLSGSTDDNGRFSIEGVLEYDNVTVRINKDWFREARITLSVAGDVVLDPVTMTYSDYSPLNVNAENADNAASVSWDAPGTTCTVCYDSGVAGSQIGFNDTESGSYAIGTAFRQPMLLEKVQWMTTLQGGPHNALHLYIYDLDENGEPTSDLLYSERSIRNTDGEMFTYTLPAPVEAPRGCLVMLNYPGFLGLAIDNRSLEAPYRSGIYYFTADYNSGNFASMDGAGLDANLMLRAVGKPYPFNMRQDDVLPQAPASQPEWRKYRLWRESMNGNDVSAEELLTPADITSTMFADASMAQAPIGIYRYKVVSVMPDGTLSTPAYSRRVLNRMVTDVTVPVTTNALSGSAEGAEVSLVSADGQNSYSAVVDENGSAVFNGIWKGEYRLTAKLYGFKVHSAVMDFSQEDTYAVPAIHLAEIFADPANLSVVAEDGSLTDGEFRWNESGHITDDFESYADFARHPSGYVAWQYIDADGSTTVAEQAYDFPGRKSPHAFICFNPSATTPSMLPDVTTAVPHSGNKMLASFWGALGSDDYVISPRLNYFTPFTFSLYGRRRSVNYLETFRMGYSMTTPEPEAFTWGPVCDPEADGWLKFSLDVPAGARYVAVNSTSDDGFILFLDDFDINSNSGMPMYSVESAPEVRYEVELDGKVLGQTEDCSFPLTGLSAGEHTAAVTAVYASGRSAKSSIRFNLASAIGEVVADSDLTVTPNPAVDVAAVSADFSEARLYSVSGQLLRVFPGTQGRLLRVGDLPRGAHLLSVTMPDGSVRSLRLLLK